MLQDYANDLDLLVYLESAKTLLHIHYIMHYASYTPRSLNDFANTIDTTSSATDGSPSKVNFTSRYKRKDQLSCDELEEFFKLPCEDFNACKPFQWWVEWQAQFPTLYCLAWDLLTISGMFIYFYYITQTLMHSSPGSAVAVEWIFSGGQDTISLWCASLQPETIFTLMLVKQQLRLSCVGSIDN